MRCALQDWLQSQQIFIFVTKFIQKGENILNNFKFEMDGNGSSQSSENDEKSGSEKKNLPENHLELQPLRLKNTKKFCLIVMKLNCQKF